MQQIKDNKNNTNNIKPKPPVVVILGHVDHGKSSILQKIREDFKILEKESGGITQHIGAYQITYQGKIITFIDTPGHEAFSAMRSRGAKVADIAILVVAAEEGVKPQTKEAISHIKKTGIPVIVVINKIDKPQAQPEKVKQELKENGIVVESLNGDVPCVLTSAKTGQGIDELLEIINLVAEMQELKYHPSRPASGVIIESYSDSKRGPTATLLIREGILKNTDIIGTGSTYGKIKSMEDFQSRPIKNAPAGTPVIITGLENVPGVGEKFSVFPSIKEAKEQSERKSAKRKEKREVINELGEKKVLNIILKTDVKGSIEAIYQSLKTIPQEEVIIRILKAEPGDISENDIKLAESSNGKIIGFRVKAPSKIKDIAKRKDIKIYIFEVIYELVQKIRELASSLLEPEIVKKTIGKVKILAIFSKTKRGQIIGGRVIDGQAKKGLANIIREEKVIGEGKIDELQHNKKDVSFVEKGMECGILFNTDIIIQKGDILEICEEERIKRNL
ncbi:translation initiation factor IF-2 [bacterium]|nr:translation initiation factor IF-2 [bacterium]